MFGKIELQHRSVDFCVTVNYDLLFKEAPFDFLLDHNVKIMPKTSAFISKESNKGCIQSCENS